MANSGAGPLTTPALPNRVRQAASSTTATRPASAVLMAKIASPLAALIGSISARAQKIAGHSQV